MEKEGGCYSENCPEMKDIIRLLRKTTKELLRGWFGNSCRGFGDKRSSEKKKKGKRKN
jgi:hypothetical protein